MAAASLRRLLTGVGPLLGLALLLLTSLQLMSDATQNSAKFGELYSLLLVVNVLGLAALTVMILRNLYRLLWQLRRREAGSRLTARMLARFVVLAVTPVVVVFYFSLQFLQQGIDSWFDVRIEAALSDALELSRTALGVRMRELVRQTGRMGGELSGTPSELAALQLGELRQRGEASELALLSSNGRVLATSSADSTAILPNLPDEATLLQVRQTGSYVALDPIPEVGLRVRVLVRVENPMMAGDPRVLQALFPITERMSQLAESVQSAFGHYRELAYLRKPLKKTFTLTLSLVLLVSLLTSVWAAFYSARRLAAPIQDLAEGTRAVADGNYETQLPQSGRDEMGFLVQSFNEMTRKLAQARDQAARSQQAVEEQRTYLEAVLARLSSGVVTFDHARRLYTANQAASQILGVDLNACLGQGAREVSAAHPHLASAMEVLERHLEGSSHDWREEVSLYGPHGRQIVMFRGAPLTGLGEHVLVFDDVTALIQAQRDAAWSEVARRLAHEIKNPLTPIQLSAERLRHKYLPKMADRDRELLDRLTHTIVQQVEAMKGMVNAFSNYARSPRMQAESLNLNDLAREVLDLYRYGPEGPRIERRLAPDLPPMEADPGRLRQLLHNLVKNAVEAPGERTPRVIRICTRTVHDAPLDSIELCVEDNGDGFPGAILERVFEPYVTDKPKGTGLGLAIVKKIAEEHGGVARAGNRPEGGARIVLRFPAKANLG